MLVIPSLSKWHRQITAVVAFKPYLDRRSRPAGSGRRMADPVPGNREQNEET